MSDTPTPTPLRICMVSDDFLPGATGVGTHVQTVSAGLAARGHSISIITTRRPGEPEFEVWKGVRVHRVPTVCIAGFYQGLPGRRRIARILDEEQPQLIHQHYLGVMLMQVSAEARRRGLKQVYTHHMTVDVLVQPWFMRPWRPLLERVIVRSINQMDLVISVSEGIAATLPGSGVTRPVRVVSNPVDFPDPMTVQPAPRDADFVVLFAGRLEPEKNVSLLIRGFAEFARGGANTKLWIAGRGSQRAQLEALATEAGVMQQISFLGFLGREQLASHYKSCDVFALPSLVETQGLVAMEAMWYGKPVLVADSIAPCRELVIDGDNGTIFDHRSPHPLARSLNDWYGAPERRLQAGAQSLRRSQAWAWPQIAPVLESLYLKATDRPRADGP